MPQGPMPGFPPSFNPGPTAFGPNVGPTQQGPLQQAPAASELPAVPAEKTIQDLNQLIANPATTNLEEKLSAMEEAALSSQANAETIDALRRNLMQGTSGLTGAERMNAVDSKRAAAIALSLLNNRMNSTTPTAQLPGFAEMQALVNNPNESPEVKKAVLQGLRVLNRSKDPDIINLAKTALKKDKQDPQIKQLAESLIQGKPAVV